MAEIEFISFDEYEWLRGTGDAIFFDGSGDCYVAQLKTIEGERLSARALVKAIEANELAEAAKAGYDYQKHNKVRRKR